MELKSAMFLNNFTCPIRCGYGLFYRGGWQRLSRFRVIDHHKKTDMANVMVDVLRIAQKQH